MAATTYDIPLQPSVPQVFSVTLLGVDYKFKLLWRDAYGSWIATIYDQYGTPLVAGLPLVTGANLLAQYPYLGIGGELWIMTDGAPSDPPNFNTLGVTSHLRFIVGGTLVWKWV